MDEEAFKTEVVRRAMRDPAFCAALKADPKGTIERTLGQPLPDSLSVEVLQEAPSRMYLVLPLAAAETERTKAGGESLGDKELDDAALEAVTGGASHMAHPSRYEGALNRALDRRLRRNQP